MPWPAVARMQVPGVSRCTAVVVSPHFVATAAHCLTTPALGHFVRPGSVHLLFGYDAGGYTRHVLADGIVLAPGADSGGRIPLGSDVALLHVPVTLSPVLAIETAVLAPGAALRLAGFSQDRAERLSIDPDCRAKGYAAGANGAPVLLHNCTGTRGTSGGPLLMQGADGAWRVAGIAVAAGEGAGGVAIPGFAVAALLAQ